MPHWIPSPGTHLLWGTLALLVYVLSTRIDQIRRPPTSAIAWVLGLALLPYLFLPLYLLFGRRKVKLARAKRPTGFDPEAHWAAALIESFGLAPPRPTAVRFHSDGLQARAALWEVIESAEKRLDLCTFLVGDDALGRELVQRLTARAQAGVAVRLMVDGAGLWLARHPSFEGLRAAGGHVATFHPLFELRPRGLRNLRNHRKLALADDLRLWSGGRNLASEYFCGDSAPGESWIDLSFDLSGAVAADAARQFGLDWGRACREQRPRAIEFRGVAHGPEAQFLPSGPDQPEDTAQALLMTACYRARDRVLAVSPYFVPDESLLTAMRLAALRGVQVILVIPHVSNHRLADFARGRALRLLAAAGAEIRLVPQMVHAKAVVADNTIGICGSINLDARSLLINYESAVVFYGAQEIAWLTHWIEALSTRGALYVPRQPSLARDLAEGLLLMLAFQL